MWCVYEFGKQIRVRAGLRKKCASKLVWSVYEFGKQTRSESWFEKSVCKLVCDVCMKFNDLYVKRWANIETFS